MIGGLWRAGSQISKSSLHRMARLFQLILLTAMNFPDLPIKNQVESVSMSCLCGKDTANLQILFETTNGNCKFSYGADCGFGLIDYRFDNHRKDKVSACRVAAG